MVQKWYGWKGTILRIKLSNNKVVKQDLPRNWARDYIGCRGINSKILYDETKPRMDPFSPENKLIFGTGPLDGTPFGMGRMSISTKSPRYTLAEGGIGGFFGPELKFAGYDHIVIEGKAKKPTYIWIDDGNIEIRDATHIWGKTTSETDEIIKEEVGDQDIQMMYIGPAAEKLVHACPVISGLHHAGCRAGCGTVMGSKKLKAIAVRGSGGVKVAQPNEVENRYKELYELLTTPKKMKDPWWPSFIFLGPALVNRVFNDVGTAPALNFQRMSLSWKDADDISGERYLEKYVVRPQSCFCCTCPGCGAWFEVNNGPCAGTKGAFLTALAGTLGPLVGVTSLPTVLTALVLCNQLGLDAMHVAYSVAWAMECFEKGIISKKDTDGLEFRFGNAKAYLEMIEKIAYRDGFGDILANGVEKASEIIGRGSERYKLTVKGQEIEGMPERHLYVAALGVATDAVGPDHTRWYPPYLPNPAIVSEESLRQQGINFDPKKASIGRLPQGKGRFLKFLTDRAAVIESIPGCIFVYTRGILGLNIGFLRDILVAVTGVDITIEELMNVGERIVTLERAFNVREGFRREHDTIPRRMLEEPVPDKYYGPLTQEELNLMLDEYYASRGWDRKTGVPTRKKLEELRLKKVADEFDKIGVKY